MKVPVPVAVVLGCYAPQFQVTSRFSPLDFTLGSDGVIVITIRIAISENPEYCGAASAAYQTEPSLENFDRVVHS